ncbi:SDR family NAD(P)-dependent oxidoreductase [Metallosphaera tengchongensis]|uniref:SDR family NAD(P)-dependent oxidoreductase n=1 Tax=Metallosphaera tengchongensis TaxID=1532350 RepID=A0A6N0NWA6_9CREN|nr:SDR family NAD(P)-dependent oxidoreductase [Metallosphaera tengchongensis]QKQ99400.1 SDR family NAD(P)-dependent oxidoreductase [Metallosphaera tengchongensis]
MFPVKGKRVLITASTEGIGRGVAETFSENGATVVISSRSREKLKSAITEMRRVSPSVYGIESDMTDYKSLASLVSYAIKVMGGIDVLVVNTGNPIREPVTFSETEIVDWENSVRLYLLGAIYVTKLALEDMVKRRWGRVIYLSSWTVKEPQSILVLADVSRSPLLQLTKILSKDYGKHGVTFNTVLMGSFNTPGAKRTLSKYAESKGVSFEEVWKERVLNPIAVGRTGDVKKDLGSLLLFLSSDFSEYITGTSILLDGGTSSAL